MNTDCGGYGRRSVVRCWHAATFRTRVPVEQDDSAGPVLLLLAEQLAEPFQARG